MPTLHLRGAVLETNKSNINDNRNNKKEVLSADNCSALITADGFYKVIVDILGAL